MKKLVRDKEYGQIELNQVAFRRDGRIIAQYKLDSDIEYVENGMLLGVDYATKTIKYPDGTLPVALNYTTEHMYDERLVYALKHFRLDNNTFLPRLGLLAAGDRFTTSTVCHADEVTPVVGMYGKPCTTEGFEGYIELVTEKDAACVVMAIEITTMPDNTPAVKFVAL